EVFGGERRNGLTGALALFGLVVGLLLTAIYARVEGRLVMFGGMYVADELAYVLKLFGFLFVAAALVSWQRYLALRGIMRGEYFVLSLTALIGVSVLVSANSLLTVYIGVQLLALSAYAMVAFHRDSGIAA